MKNNQDQSNANILNGNPEHDIEALIKLQPGQRIEQESFVFAKNAIAKANIFQLREIINNKNLLEDYKNLREETINIFQNKKESTLKTLEKQNVPTNLEEVKESYKLLEAALGINREPAPVIETNIKNGIKNIIKNSDSTQLKQISEDRELNSILRVIDKDNSLKNSLTSLLSSNSPQSSRVSFDNDNEIYKGHAPWSEHKLLEDTMPRNDDNEIYKGHAPWSEHKLLEDTMPRNDDSNQFTENKSSKIRLIKRIKNSNEIPENEINSNEIPENEINSNKIPKKKINILGKQTAGTTINPNNKSKINVLHKQNFRVLNDTIKSPDGSKLMTIPAGSKGSENTNFIIQNVTNSKPLPHNIKIVKKGNGRYL